MSDKHYNNTQPECEWSATGELHYDAVIGELCAYMKEHADTSLATEGLHVMNHGTEEQIAAFIDRCIEEMRKKTRACQNPLSE